METTTQPRFLQFPIGLLAISPSDDRLALHNILSWCLRDVGARTYASFSMPQLKEEMRRQGNDALNGQKAVCADDYRHALAAGLLNVSLGNMEVERKQLRTLDVGVSRLSPVSFNNRAQIKMDWFWSCYHTLNGTPTDRTLSFREFRVLAALLSKLGVKGFNKCAWLEIQARAAGSCGKADFLSLPTAERAKREPLVLTRMQIRGTLERLEADEFFARYQHGWNGKARESWFSFAMTRDALREHIITRKVRVRETLMARRLVDLQSAAARQPILSQPVTNINRDGLNGGETANINGTGQDTQTVANPVTNPPANAVANINKNDLNKNDSNTNERKENTSLTRRELVSEREEDGSIPSKPDWRSAYTDDELRVIDLYHDVCVPRGFWPVDADSAALHEALYAFQDHDADWFATAFREAVEERDTDFASNYNTDKGNKLLRILWANY